MNYTTFNQNTRFKCQQIMTIWNAAKDVSLFFHSTMAIEFSAIYHSSSFICDVSCAVKDDHCEKTHVHINDTGMDGLLYVFCNGG